MIVFPNCKINLGLHITGKRADGFHNLETVFYPVPLTDALELIPGHNNSELDFTTSGLAVAGDPADNLCIKAYHLLKKDFPKIPPVKAQLHKAIPMGAGLGGGSADAAFMLKLLNDRFRLDMPAERLAAYALQLGSDCPFFIVNKPCFATGRGELLEEISLNLSAYRILLINPGIHINTGWAFSNITPAPPERSIKEIIAQPVNTWKTGLTNDFESPVFAAHPAIQQTRDSLYEQGAIYAAMSGSGSTLFGIFAAGAKMTATYPANYFVKLI